MFTTSLLTQVKSAFTRSFNKTGHLCHYATTAPAKKKSYSQDGEEGGEGEREEPADVPVDKNPMIKVVKDKGKGKGNGKEPPKTSKGLPKTSKGKGQTKKNRFIL